MCARAYETRDYRNLVTMADRFLVNLHLVLNAHLSRWRNWSVACSVQALSRSAVSDSLICPKVRDTLYIHIL